MTVPAEIILQLIEVTNANPHWLLHGTGSKYQVLDYLVESRGEVNRTTSTRAMFVEEVESDTRQLSSNSRPKPNWRTPTHHPNGAVRRGGGPVMAQKIGCPVRSWYNYETGVTVRAEIILRFLEVTNASPRWLLHGTGGRYLVPSRPVALGQADSDKNLSSLIERIDCFARLSKQKPKRVSMITSAINKRIRQRRKDRSSSRSRLS